MYDHGFIPLGRYSCARDSILHYMCLSDWANESYGDTEAPTGYFWRISNDPEDVQIGNTETDSLLSEWIGGSPEVVDSPELRAELAGHFLIVGDSDGHVYVARYETESELLSEYGARGDEFMDWDTQDED